MDSEIKRISDIGEIQRLVQERVDYERGKYAPVAEEGSPDDCPFSSEEIWQAVIMGDDGFAWLYKEIQRRKISWDTGTERSYLWGPHHWRVDTLNDALRGVDAVIDVLLAELLRISWQQEGAAKAGKDAEVKSLEERRNILLKSISRLHKLKTKEDVLELARTGSDSLAVSGDIWDQDPMLLAVANGVIGLRTGALRPGQPEDYIRTASLIEYKGLNEPAPRWEKFQKEICNGNQELVDFKQRLFGYAITGQNKEHIFPIQYGKGANGKSTENEIISKILGDYSGQIEAEVLLSNKFGKQSGGASPDVLSLMGKRFIICSETEEGRYFNASKVKWLSGADTLTARGLYSRNYIRFKPSHKIFLSTNHKPHIKNDDYAFWRRVILIPYPLQFVPDPKKPDERKVDLDLSEELWQEASGILAWLVRGCLAWQNEGLNPPEIVKAATREYREAEDSLGKFIEECCIIGADKIAPAGQVYDVYKTWCSRMECSSLSGVTFGLKMKELFTCEKNYKGVFYKGLGLIDRNQQ